MKRANSSDKRERISGEISLDKESVEIKLARELRKPLTYCGRQETKLDVVVEQAINHAITGNFRPFLTVMKCKELLNQATASAKESEQQWTQTDIDKMSSDELHKYLREAIARSKPLSAYTQS